LDLIELVVEAVHEVVVEAELEVEVGLVVVELQVGLVELLEQLVLLFWVR